MCIAVFLWQSHPLYPLLLLLNRDEYHQRPTERLAWWNDGEIIGGRDELAAGTWLACSRHGRLAFLTNFREVQLEAAAQSRGDLPVRFLKSQKSPAEFAEEILEEADGYNGFNLVVADLCSKSMFYITNRFKGEGNFRTEVSPGIHVLSNANLDSPWPKCQRLSRLFRQLVDEYGERELPPEKEIVDKLMTNTVKDEESELPHIYPTEVEYSMSSIFVDMARPMGGYGTRSMSAVRVASSNDIRFYERTLEKGHWDHRTLTFKIENRNQMV